MSSRLDSRLDPSDATVAAWNLWVRPVDSAIAPTEIANQSLAREQILHFPLRRVGKIVESATVYPEALGVPVLSIQGEIRPFSCGSLSANTCNPDVDRWGSFVYVDYPDCAVMDVQLHGRNVTDAGRICTEGCAELKKLKLV